MTNASANKQSIRLQFYRLEIDNELSSSHGTSCLCIDCWGTRNKKTPVTLTTKLSCICIFQLHNNLGNLKGTKNHKFNRYISIINQTPTLSLSGDCAGQRSFTSLASELQVHLAASLHCSLKTSFQLIDLFFHKKIRRGGILLFKCRDAREHREMME